MALIQPYEDERGYPPQVGRVDWVRYDLRCSRPRRIFDALAVEVDLFSRLKGADAAPLVVATSNQTPDNDTILWNVPYGCTGFRPR